MYLTILDVLSKWNRQCVVFCGRLLSLSITSLRFIHGVACIRILFLYAAICYPIELFACKHGVRSVTQEDKQREPIGLNSVPVRRKDTGVGSECQPGCALVGLCWGGYS